MNITVIGTGYVGLINAVGLADFGNNVIGVDLQQDTVDTLNTGKATIYELGLDEYLHKNWQAGRLVFTTDYARAIRNADVVFITVGTPATEKGQADVSQVERAIRTVAKYLDRYTVIVLKSTVPIGTNRVMQEILCKDCGLVPARDFSIVSNPEFLREGKAVQDFFHPDRVVIGYSDGKAQEVMQAVYRALYLIQTPFIWCNFETAELIKYASNAFLATKIAFINQLANLAEAAGADIHIVAKSMGMDGRISPKFLHAGPGYGGSCFPKDTAALVHSAERMSVDISIVHEVVRANIRQKRLIAQKLLGMLSKPIKGKVVAMLGLTFKADTDDVRESPALEIADILLKHRVRIQVYDPEGMDNFRAAMGNVQDIGYCTNEFEAAKNADILIIVTEWNIFRSIDLQKIYNVMNTPVIFDTRNVLYKEEVQKKGFVYHSIGR